MVDRAMFALIAADCCLMWVATAVFYGQLFLLAPVRLFFPCMGQLVPPCSLNTLLDENLVCQVCLCNR